MHVLPSQKSIQEFDNFLDSKKGKAVLSGGVTVGILVAASQPSDAAGIADVTAMVGDLGSIAAAITTVVLGAMGVRYAIKLVNRVAVKG